MKVDPPRLALLCVLLAVGLNGLFALDFMLDPLGLSPVLDGRENLAWAERISAGELPDEPFYRALLYPAILAVMAKAGLLSGAAATIFGVICHLISASLTGLIARRIWQQDAAGWFAGLLYAVYPVAMWFSVQVLDISFAITLFLAAIWLLLRSGDAGRWPNARRGCLLAAGLVGGGAVLARPNFLPAVILLPVLPILLRWVQGEGFRHLLGRGALVCVGLGAVLLLQGLLNLQIGGVFKILPWQGSYNLYAANRDGANGKYFIQQVAFEEVPAGANPTRMESEYLYHQQVGPEAPATVSAMSAHWRAQLVESILEDPLRWLGLMGRKAAYLLNDWEQYNNLSYAYHKERFHWLNWNPLGWGIILLGASVAFSLNWRYLAKREGAALGLVALAYAAGLLLFFVSARFRLPLAPLLCVGCGGLILLLREQASWRIPRIGLAVGLFALLTTAVYGNWWQARDRSAFIQDEILLADAALRVGADGMALDYATKALERDSTRQDARRLQVSANFNLWLGASGPAAGAYWTSLIEAAGKIEQADAMTWFVRGVIKWRNGARSAAVAAWREGLLQYGPQAVSCARALQAVGEVTDLSPSDPGVEAIRELLER